MAFSLMNGLSAAGATIATQAGAEGLEMQKSDLESQRDQLAAATANTYKLGQIKAEGAQDILTKQAEEPLAEQLAQKTSDIGVAAAKQTGIDAATLADKLGNDPNHIAALKNINSADPRVAAQAAEADAQAGLAAIGTKTATALYNAKDAIVKEQSKPGGGDPAVLEGLQKTYGALATTPEAQAALRTNATNLAAANQKVVSDLNLRISTETNALSNIDNGQHPEAYKAKQDEIDDLKSQRDNAMMLSKAATANANAQSGINIINGPPPPGKAPAGSGTKAAPYIGASQADIDWFKANAKAGDVLSANGQLYTK